jgi:beta-phosphoglucomutase
MAYLNKKMAGLFDLDGVILDTEKQYTVFWTGIMRKYKGDDSPAQKIKGSTLEKIYTEWFFGMEKEQQEITSALAVFERNMKLNYIPGLTDFVHDLKVHKVKCAIVTSSNKAKMAAVRLQHPELENLFDRILTAEMFERSKPAPDPYLLGATIFNIPPEDCFVFEDSFNGLKSGRAAGMHVIGLATTNSPEAIRDYADIVIPDFTGMTYERLTAGKHNILS